VFLAGLLTNNGDQPTLKTEIQAWSESPTTGTVLTTINELTGIPIPPLQPGEIREVLYRWENAINPGNHRVWLRANRPPQTRESTMEDNDLEIPPITLLPLPNMRAEVLGVNPPVITPNQRAVIKFEVSDEWPGGRGPIEVQFGFENPLTGKTSTRTFSLPDLEKKQVIEGPVEAGPEPVIAFAMVNSDKEWEELDIKASRSAKPTNLLLPATTWLVSASDGSHVSLAEILPLSVPDGTRYIPGQGLAIDSTANGIRHDILPIPSHARSMAARPNMGPDDILGRATWRFRDNTFQAAAVPDPSDLTLRVPVDPSLGTITTASLSVEVALGQIPGVTHEFSLSSGPDRPFVPVSVPPDPNRRAQWVPIGPVTITSGVVNLRVRPGTMRESSIGRIGVLTPTASAVSPWLEVPADWKSGVVRIQPVWLAPPAGETQSDSAHVEIRTATPGADPASPLVAGPWVRPNSGDGVAEVPIASQTAAIQWRLIMRTRHTEPQPNAKPNAQPTLSEEGLPVLTDLRLEYTP
jgi:hypothetical protein